MVHNQVGEASIVRCEDRAGETELGERYEERLGSFLMAAHHGRNVHGEAGHVVVRAGVVLFFDADVYEAWETR